ncbi:ADP-ribose pyrophosphatase YjhB (NUDIX family) [Marinomonas alcarazii]|uniref:ADP-ribose pyrophosphatase YjhB (NUDIX family) n=1 Tax=Marinomonas alcarazii TaxID=491949 RepID=A0A318UV01_9GAMM|nr:NUDIX hydrolase [Marinomonas alcarazii]PYF79257.1 ADP-ribose pyrophosphatase YjhB (NUDIX family) [Marinomonas alcarazii]
MRYCPQCGHAVNMTVPAGDNRLRAVCPSCEFIDYDNPRLITGTIPLYDGKILLCRRNIEPRLGFWTLPAGFMENQETTSEGALRETLEESGSVAICKQAFSMISIPHINQVHLFYIAELERDDFHATEESSEVALFALDEIPWDELAFSSVRKTIELFITDHKKGQYGFHEDTIHFNTVQE